MTIWDLTVKFAYLIFFLILGMMIVSTIRRLRITICLRRLSGRIDGQVSQKGIRSFPRFDCKYDGRKASIFFHTARTKKAHLVYLLFAIGVDLPFKLFLLRKDEFKFLEGFNIGVDVGPPIECLNNGFKAWSNDPASSELLLNHEGLKKDIDFLTEFPSLLFGPDLIIIAKQYEVKRDLSPDSMAERLLVIGRMAEKAEVLCKG